MLGVTTITKRITALNPSTKKKRVSRRKAAGKSNNRGESMKRRHGKNRRHRATPLRRRRRPNPSVSAAPRRRRRSNPVAHSRRRRSNPSASSRITASAVARGAVVAGASFIAARELPQMLLKEKNTGLIGYAANLATGVGISMAAKAFGSKKDVFPALIGAGMAVLSRAMSDQTPIGRALAQPLSGIGDPNTITGTQQARQFLQRVQTQAAAARKIKAA
jgi:hypothetical protein